MSDISRTVALALACLLLATPAGAAGFGGLTQESVDPDAVVMTVDLRESADADWAVTYRVRLADDDETAAFESLREDVQANESAYTDRFAERMRATVRTAENATGREMSVENVSVETEVTALPQEYGVITYRFRWTNFAAVEGEELRAGDALAGLFLDEESTLRMRWPAGYARTSATPSPDGSDERSVTWEGARTFDADEPRLVVRPGRTETTAGGGSDGGDGSDGGEGTNGTGDAWLVVLAAVVGLGGVAALLWATHRYDLVGGAVAAGDADADGDATAESADDGPPPELLSNEERVLALLEGEGGRMKQQRIAADLDWTAAKTSQVIGDLREADEVETFRIGRENVVTLPDVDVAGDGDE